MSLQQDLILTIAAKYGKSLFAVKIKELCFWRLIWWNKQMHCATGSASSLEVHWEQSVTNFVSKRITDKDIDWVSPLYLEKENSSLLKSWVFKAKMSTFQMKDKIKQHYENRSAIWYRSKLMESQELSKVVWRWLLNLSSSSFQEQLWTES